MKAKHVFLRIRMMCIAFMALLCASCTVLPIQVVPQPFLQQRVVGVGTIGGVGGIGFNGFGGFNSVGGIGCRPPMIAPGGFHPQFGGWGGQGGWNHPGFGRNSDGSFQYPSIRYVHPQNPFPQGGYYGPYRRY